MHAYPHVPVLPNSGSQQVVSAAILVVGFPEIPPNTHRILYSPKISYSYSRGYIWLCISSIKYLSYGYVIPSRVMIDWQSPL